MNAEPLIHSSSDSIPKEDGTSLICGKKSLEHSCLVLGTSIFAIWWSLPSFNEMTMEVNHTVKYSYIKTGSASTSIDDAARLSTFAANL